MQNKAAQNIAWLKSTLKDLGYECQEKQVKSKSYLHCENQISIEQQKELKSYFKNMGLSIIFVVLTSGCSIAII